MLKCLLIAVLLLATNLSNGQSADSLTFLNVDPAALSAKYNFPLPGEVLKLRQQLALTALQVSRLNDINKTLLLKRAETTISHARNEHVLDSMFRTRRLNEGSIIFYTNRYGLYQGELRGALLIACYNTRQVLTAAQLAKFAQLQKP